MVNALSEKINIPTEITRCTKKVASFKLTYERECDKMEEEEERAAEEAAKRQLEAVKRRAEKRKAGLTNGASGSNKKTKKGKEAMEE